MRLCEVNVNLNKSRWKFISFHFKIKKFCIDPSLTLLIKWITTNYLLHFKVVVLSDFYKSANLKIIQWLYMDIHCQRLQNIPKFLKLKSKHLKIADDSASPKKIQRIEKYYKIKEILLQYETHWFWFTCVTPFFNEMETNVWTIFMLKFKSSKQIPNVMLNFMETIW